MMARLSRETVGESLGPRWRSRATAHGVAGEITFRGRRSGRGVDEAVGMTTTPGAGDGPGRSPPRWARWWRWSAGSFASSAGD